MHNSCCMAKKNNCVCYILLPNPPVNQHVLEVGLITLWRLDVFYQCIYGIILIVIAFISEVLRSFLFDFSYMK